MAIDIVVDTDGSPGNAPDTVRVFTENGAEITDVEGVKIEWGAEDRVYHGLQFATIKVLLRDITINGR